MREQTVSEAIGNVMTPDRDTFARVAESLYDRAEAMLREAIAIAEGPIPDGSAITIGEGKITDQVGALIAGVLSESARVLAQGIAVAARFEYSTPDDARGKARIEKDDPRFVRLMRRGAALAETALKSTALRDAHLGTDAVVASETDAVKPPIMGPSGRDLEKLLRALSAYGVGPEPKRKPIGFGGIPRPITDDGSEPVN